MQTFPLIRDLVTDVSWNFEGATHYPAVDRGSRTRRPAMEQIDVDRVQEFRKCIECFLCQDVCHVLRDHDKTYFGPRFMVRSPRWKCTRSIRRTAPNAEKRAAGIGYCNITKCCTEVCPEHIKSPTTPSFR